MLQSINSDNGGVKPNIITHLLPSVEIGYHNQFYHILFIILNSVVKHQV